MDRYMRRFKKNELNVESRFDNILIIELNDKIHILNQTAQIVYDNCESLSTKDICDLVVSFISHPYPEKGVICDDINSILDSFVNEKIVLDIG